MVYRLIQPKRRGLGWFLRVIVLRRLILVAIVLGGVSLLLSETCTVSPIGIGVALLFFLVMDVLAYRLHAKVIAAQGTQFVTLTEAGLMVEGESTGVRRFVPWSRLERGWLRQGMLMVQEVSGLFHLFPTESLSRKREEEMLAFVSAHAGRKTPSPLPPPAAMLTDSPVRVSAGKAQWQEYVDYLYRFSQPGVQVGSYVAIAILCSAVPLCLLAAVPLLLVPLLLLIGFLLYMLRHPGGLARRLRKSPRPGWMHVGPEGMLALSDDGAWAAIPTRLVDSALQMRHGVIYHARPYFISLADSTPTLSPYLPQPRRPRRCGHVVGLVLSVVVLPVVSALCYLGLELESGMESYYEARDRGAALVSYVEELLPPQEYPGHLECLYFADSGILFMEWECGLEANLILDDDFVSDESAEESSGEEE